MNESKHRFPRSQYSAIVFDYDGTLVSTAATKRMIWREAAYSFWGDHNKLWCDYFAMLPTVLAGTPRAEIIRLAVQAAPRLADGSSPLTVKAQEGIFNYIAEHIEELVPEPTEGLMQLLVSLPADMPLYVVSGAPDAEVKAGLEAACLTDWFDGVEGNKEAHGTKADALLDLCAREGYDPLRVLYVGDTAGDMVSADVAGMTGIFYGPDSQRPAPELAGLYEGVDYFTAEKWSHFRVCEQH